MSLHQTGAPKQGFPGWGCPLVPASIACSPGPWEGERTSTGIPVTGPGTIISVSFGMFNTPEGIQWFSVRTAPGTTQSSPQDTGTELRTFAFVGSI